MNDGEYARAFIVDVAHRNPKRYDAYFLIPFTYLNRLSPVYFNTLNCLILSAEN